ncbi:Ig-like domain repeat protein [Methanobrevibacter sp.]|uniref:Ig-like domain repeat protein n=1 Tax=Methanobrevibacter sp. TaxID=66852 RepID=UPI00388DDF57
MKINKIIFTLFLLFIVLMISAVSAEEMGFNETTNISVPFDGSSDDVLEGHSIYVDTRGKDSRDGSSESTAIKTIKKAISIANENDTIYLSSGSFSTVKNTKLTIDKSLNFVGSKDTTINGLNLNYIFDIKDGVTVSFKNIKFINAYKSPESYSVSYKQSVYGAALDIKDAVVTIDNCSFINCVLNYGTNDKYIYGGAISNFGNLTILNSYFYNNTALSTSGLFSYGGSVYNKGKLAVSNTTFSNSRSVDFGYGGAIANDGKTVMSDSHITGSRSLHECKGSAIYNTGDFSLFDSIIENNYIERGNFNIIYGTIYNSGTFTARGSIFRNNTGFYETPMPSYKGSGNIYNIGLLNLTYNAFMDNPGFDGISNDIYFNGGDVISLDNNWWNVNTNPYSDGSKVNVDKINSWLILNLTPEYSKLNISDSVTISAIWTNNINLLPQINLFPTFNITFNTFVNGNQITQNKQLAGGKAEFMFNYTQNKGGYDVVASLGSFNQSVIVDVGKVLTYVTYTVIDNITYLDDLNVDVEVYANGKLIGDGKVLLKIADETYTLDLVNGRGSIAIPDLTPQKYDVDIIYEGDDDHFKAFNRTSVTIQKQDVDISLRIPEIKVGQKGSAVVTLGPKGVQGQAILYVDGVRKKIVYLYNGDTTISLSNFAEGEYNISLEFVETSFYNSATVSGILNVTRYDASINISAEDVKVGENATITVKVSPESLRGEATLIIKGENNTIFIDGSVTNVTLTNLPAGQYNVTLIFEGDLRYNTVNTSTSFKVLKTPVNLTVDIIQDDINRNGTVTVKVDPVNCTGVVGVYINYNLYKLNLTDGMAQFDVKFDKGTNYVFVFYEGNRYYSDATYNTTLGVDDEFAFIGENSTGYEYNDFNYTVRLIEINGIPMPGRIVTVTFNGKQYNITTNDDGFAYFALNLAGGEYDIEARYKNSTISNRLNVKAVDFNLTSSNITYGEDEIIMAQFEEGVRGNVSFLIGDITVEVEIVNGTATFNSSSFNVGNYTVEAKYLDKTHVAKFTVEKAELEMDVNIASATPYVDEIITVQNLNNASGEIIFVFGGSEYKVSIIDSKALLNLSKLDEGNYSITVRYLGDNNYHASNKTLSFYVKELASDIILTVSDEVYGKDIVVTAELNDNATGTVTFKAGNLTKNITISNGKAIWTFTGLDVGSYIISANYLGNEYYVDSYNETSVTVSKANSTIDVYVREVYLGENIRIYADLSPNATGSVSFSMIGYYSPRNKPISNSRSTWYISPLDTGEYTVIAKYAGDRNYYASNATYILSVNQKKTIMVAQINDAGLNDRVICTVSLNTKDGIPITDIVKLTIGAKEYEIYVFDGKGSLVLGKMATGNYTYSVKYEGTDNYTAATAEGKFKVVDDLLDVKISASDFTKYFGGTTPFKVILKDSNGNPFAGQDIFVRIGSTGHDLYTDSNGEAFLDINLNVGTYEAYVYFAETDRYHEAFTKANITVLSTLEGIDVIKVYGSGTQYFAIFTDANGNALGNTKVVFTISGKSYTLTTLPNGIARININFKVGNYVISTVNPVTGQKLSNKITIYKKIVGKDVSNYYGAKSIYKVRIYGDDAKPVGAGKLVAFKVNGKTYKIKTDKNGYAKLTVKLKTKKYTVTASYGGVKVSNKITVKNVLSAKNISKKKNQKVKFSAKLVNSKGKILKGKKITFKIKGKKYTAKTNKKGIATVTIKIKLKVGKHKIKAIYGKSSLTKTITIKK